MSDPHHSNSLRPLHVAPDDFAGLAHQLREVSARSFADGHMTARPPGTPWVNVQKFVERVHEVRASDIAAVARVYEAMLDEGEHVFQTVQATGG